MTGANMDDLCGTRMGIFAVGINATRVMNSIQSLNGFLAGPMTAADSVATLTNPIESLHLVLVLIDEASYEQALVTVPSWIRAAGTLVWCRIGDAKSTGLLVSPANAWNTTDKLETSFCFPDDEVGRDSLRQLCQAIVHTIGITSFVGIDFQDVRFVLGKNGTTAIGFSRGVGEDAAESVTRHAIRHKLLGESKLLRAQGCLVAIHAGTNWLRVETTRAIATIVRSVFPEDSQLFYTIIPGDFGSNELVVTIIATGILN